MTDCSRCERDWDDVEYVAVLDAELCDACLRALDENIEYYNWKKKYTEDQHERATSLFSEREEILCVINSYEDGQIVVHTQYVTSDVVTDFCDHFGFEIVAFGPRWEQEESWPCMSEHGSIFEIVLEYNNSCDPPAPMTVKFIDNDIERVDENDKQF